METFPNIAMGDKPYNDDTELYDIGEICIVTIYQRGKIWIFGVYDTEELARKRVKEQDFLIPSDSYVAYHKHIVWGAVQ